MNKSHQEKDGVKLHKLLTDNLTQFVLNTTINIFILDFLKERQILLSSVLMLVSKTTFSIIPTPGPRL